MRLHAFEYHHTPGDEVVIGQVNPAHAAVRNHAEDFILAGDDIAGLELRRGKLLFLNGLRRVYQRIFGCGGNHERQGDHAVSNFAVGARCQAQLAESIQRLLA